MAHLHKIRNQDNPVFLDELDEVVRRLLLECVNTGSIDLKGDPESKHARTIVTPAFGGDNLSILEQKKQQDTLVGYWRNDNAIENYNSQDENGGYGTAFYRYVYFLYLRTKIDKISTSEGVSPNKMRLLRIEKEIKDYICRNDGGVTTGKNGEMILNPFTVTLKAPDWSGKTYKIATHQNNRHIKTTSVKEPFGKNPVFYTSVLEMLITFTSD